jgi:hypothetical protein
MKTTKLTLITFLGLLLIGINGYSAPIAKTIKKQSTSPYQNTFLAELHQRATNPNYQWLIKMPFGSYVSNELSSIQQDIKNGKSIDTEWENFITQYSKVQAKVDSGLLLNKKERAVLKMANEMEKHDLNNFLAILKHFSEIHNVAHESENNDKIKIKANQPDTESHNKG